MKTVIYMSCCYRWTEESFWQHNLRHIKASRHFFCRTIRCDQGGCPVGGRAR